MPLRLSTLFAHMHSLGTLNPLQMLHFDVVQHVDKVSREVVLVVKGYDAHLNQLNVGE